ncbi:nitroreductase/quinone reductase family protein [Actinoalloteichus hymeniacidonis]|uniref:Hemerythrin HHE cation binding domain-containing protein n=1 Tax=Actinoalloteichus hymeniacidonis TaxID=340345 RepID=A0AAC9MX42_9PSEU|nr:nitroreductase/quinone reductase family protein [Actinoalloteichus hymeniacidonis]AOS61950.1 hemerythrin HHE cation binding domain-containing protein [Actinoalloteichus hymeniacidonis]
MSIHSDQNLVEEFRANRGNLGGRFADSRILLLTSTDSAGAKHTTPVAYLQDGLGRLLVIASADSAGSPPAWYQHIVSEPNVEVETGSFTFPAETIALEAEERQEAFDRAAEADHRLADEQARTASLIPVLVLNPLGGRPNGDTWSESLKIIHDAFRRELRLLRKEIAASGPRLGAQLRINCLSLCAGLGHHHTMEDSGMLPAVDRSHPELADATRRLREEHQAVKLLLEELQRVVSTANPDPVVLLADVERLTSEVENHLDYEEQQLFPILDTLTP